MQSTARTRMKKRKVPTLASIIQARLLEEITQSKIQPGTRLEEIELAERYQVSRTPVREALRQLSAMGMLKVTPRRGAIVVDQSANNGLQETLEVIAELEAAAARFAAKRMSADDRARLATIHGEMSLIVEAEDVVAFDRKNGELHHHIHLCAGNGLLLDSISQMRVRIVPYTRAEYMSQHSRIVTSHREHDAFVQAILRSDSELAYHAMRFHVMHAGELDEDLEARLNR
ncbi:GntR family transcriptional regulator [Zavarzinia sp.]|uniref:GntR family transcriptional regulator n=1 Tax=Zavarzinia sp. TaxID=2027920 RepID=UPI00356749ED